MRPNLLIAESIGFSAEAVDRLQAVAHVELLDSDREELLSRVHDTHVLWVRLRHHIDSEVMDAAPSLRIIASATTGLDHIDENEAMRRNIRVISLRGETDFLRNVHATAEHTMALILGVIRHVPAACEHVTRGEWNRDQFIGRELHGKTAGVVGFGRVGRMVAHYLQAFGMRVLATDPSSVIEAGDRGIEFVSLTELLAGADLTSLHVPLNTSTRGFFGPTEFSRMKRGSWFINTSRGELVDETALLVALREGRLGGAALDVLHDERTLTAMNCNQLVEYARRNDRLLITPHIGGYTSESREKTENFLAGQLVDLLHAKSDSECRMNGPAEPVELPQRT